MPRTVEINGVGEVEFPDHFTNEDITRAIETDILPNHAGANPQVLDEVVVRPKPEEPPLLDQFGDVFSGNLRKTAETESLPDWATMPELNELSLASAKTGVGTLLTDPAETVDIIKANFPDAKVRQDAKGNYLITSSVDGKEYAIKPGFRVSDIPRALGALLAFTPAGGARTVAGQVVGSAATQAAIEGSQAATGGNVDETAIAAAGAIPGAFHTISKGLNAAVGKVKGFFGGAESAIVNNTAGVAADAEQIAQRVPEQNIQQAENAARPSTPEFTQNLSDSELADLARRSAVGVTGKDAAKRELAAQVAIDAETQAAANRLGFDLEADQMTTNDQFRKLVGLARSQAGSDAEARGIASVKQSADRADEVMTQLEGSTDLSALNQKIKGTLAETRDGLEKEANQLYKTIDDTIPANTPAATPNLEKVINETLAGLGGDVKQMTPEERKLFDLATSKGLTYLGLTRERQLIGKALAGQASPYGNVAEGTLKRLYGALAQDQNEVVKNVGGEALSNQYRIANQLVAKRKALEKRIVNAFGKDSDGSIASALQNSISSASKGNDAGLNKILKVIPDDLKKQAMASALTTLSKKGEDFSFKGYANLYRNLRRNSVAYNTVVKTMGEGSHQILDDLYKVSSGIEKAQNAVLHTGKANQAFLNQIKGADSLVKNILGTVGKGFAADAATSAVGAPGVGLTAVVVGAIKEGRKDAVKAVGDVLTSPEFKSLVEEVATTGKASPAKIKSLSYSNKMRKFGKMVSGELGSKPSDYERWIVSALESSNEGQK